MAWCLIKHRDFTSTSYIVLHEAFPQLKRLIAGFPSRRPEFELKLGHVGFVVDRPTVGQFSSKYFSFSRHSFHWLLRTHHLSYMTGIIGKIVADVLSGPRLTLSQKTKKQTKSVITWGFHCSKLNWKRPLNRKYEQPKNVWFLFGKYKFQMRAKLRLCGVLWHGVPRCSRHILEWHQFTVFSHIVADPETRHHTHLCATSPP
jgi:hypothetical protein